MAQAQLAGNVWGQPPVCCSVCGKRYGQLGNDTTWYVMDPRDGSQGGPYCETDHDAALAAIAQDLPLPDAPYAAVPPA